MDPVDVVDPRAAKSTESPIDGNVADRSRAVFHLRRAWPAKSQDVKHTWGGVFHSRSGECYKLPFRQLVDPLRVVPALREEARPDWESG